MSRLIARATSRASRYAACNALQSNALASRVIAITQQQQQRHASTLNHNQQSRFASMIRSTVPQSYNACRHFGAHAPAAAHSDSHAADAHGHDSHAHDDHHHAPSDYIERPDVHRRVLEVLRRVDKIDKSLLTADAEDVTFHQLGLDSLDTMEVVMQIEDEFIIDIYDEDAADMHSIRQITDYIANFPFASSPDH